VVTAAQALLILVPSDSHLEVEAMLSNRDIGFVHPGQDVEIKVDTFPFTRYGLIHGEVLSVSHDAITRDKPADKTGEKASGAESTSSEPKGQELLTQLQVEENLVNLAAGMAVTVEIETGARAVITYLLSPLLRYKQESMRER
jgi:hemolysin D